MSEFVIKWYSREGRDYSRDEVQAEYEVQDDKEARNLRRREIMDAQAMAAPENTAPETVKAEAPTEKEVSAEDPVEEVQTPPWAVRKSGNILDQLNSDEYKRMEEHDQKVKEREIAAYRRKMQDELKRLEEEKKKIAKG